MLQSSSVKHSLKMPARFSDLKVVIRELSFPFSQEPTEKQPLPDITMVQTDNMKMHNTLYIP